MTEDNGEAGYRHALRSGFTGFSYEVPEHPLYRCVIASCAGLRMPSINALVQDKAPNVRTRWPAPDGTSGSEQREGGGQTR